MLKCFEYCFDEKLRFRKWKDDHGFAVQILLLSKFQAGKGHTLVAELLHLIRNFLVLLGVHKNEQNLQALGESWPAQLLQDIWCS